MDADQLARAATPSITPGSRSGPATQYLDALVAGQPLSHWQQGNPQHAHLLQEWRQQPGWLALEAAARTIGYHKGSRGLADQLLEATTLGVVVRTLEVAEHQGTPIQDRLRALDMLAHWQGLRPQRAGATVAITFQQAVIAAQAGEARTSRPPSSEVPTKMVDDHGLPTDQVVSTT